jgi:hypothetical protein
MDQFLNAGHHQPRLPVSDLVRVDVVLLCQFRQRLVAFYPRLRYLHVESGRVVPPLPSCDALTPSQNARSAV